jgi:pyruvate dehydrogenase phosphatase
VLAEVYSNSLQCNPANEDTFLVRHEPSGYACLAVFDGHSGGTASAFMRDSFYDAFLKPELHLAEEDIRLWGADPVDRISHALLLSFRRADRHFLTSHLAAGRIKEGLAGACSLVAVLRPGSSVPLSTPTSSMDVATSAGAASNTEHATPDTRGSPPLLFVANAGDCRAVLVSEDAETGELEWYELSEDHTPRNPKEAIRLRSEHPDEPDVVKRGRVKGFLEPSRGIGDGRYKLKEYNEKSEKPRGPEWHPPYTTSTPEIRVHTIDPTRDRAILLATDGLWEWYDSEAAARLLQRSLVATQTQAASPLAPILHNAFARVERESEAKGIPRFLALPGDERRRLYDDTTVVIGVLKHRGGA